MSSVWIHVTAKVHDVKELKFSQNGNAFLNFSASLNVGTSDEPDFQWYNITLFGKSAEALAGKIVKGTYFHVVGRNPKVNLYEKENGDVGFSIQVSTSSFEFVGAKPEDTGEEKPAKKPIKFNKGSKGEKKSEEVSGEESESAW